MIKGFIAGAFDVIHPGYVKMFEEAKNHCDHLTIGLHVNPEANGKLKPVLSTHDRTILLNSIRYIDTVFVYENEDGLVNLLKDHDFNIRFLGSDYVGKQITGGDIVPIHYLDRSHGWSTTKYKQQIYEQWKEYTQR